MPTGNESDDLTQASVLGGSLHIPSDAELLARAVAGENRAFSDLIDRHGKYLHGVAYAMTQSRADAEDLVQETLIAALKGSFRGEAKVRTWLVGILVRRVGMLRRTRRRKPVTFTDPTETPGGGLAAKGSGLGSEAKIDLATMLETLSPDHRQVIVLRELEGMSYEEMADAIGVPRGTVESRLHRAREELRKRFGGYLT